MLEKTLIRPKAIVLDFLNEGYAKSENGSREHR